MQESKIKKIKFHPRIRVPAKASAWYVISGAVARGIGVFGTPIFTRLLTPEEYGVFPLFNTWLSLFSALATLELTGGVVHRGLLRFRGREREYLFSALGLIFCLFALFCSLYLLFFERIINFTGLSAEAATLLPLQILFSSVSGLFLAKCRFEYKYKTVAAISIITALLIPGVSVLLIYTTPMRAMSRIVGTVLVNAALAFILLSLLGLSSGQKISFKMWGYMLKFSLPLLPHYLSVAAILRVGEIAVGRIYGTAALGKYSVAMSLGLSLTMVTNGLISALGPWIMRKARAEENEKISDLLLTVSRGVALLSLFLLSVAPELLLAITGPVYYEALFAIYPLSLTVIPMFLSGAFSSWSMYYEKNTRSLFPSLISAVICSVLSLIILPYFHFSFAGIFSLISYILLALLSALTLKSLSGRFPISVKRIAYLFLFVSFYALLFFLLRENLLSRTILATSLLPILFLTARSAWDRIKE